MNLDHMTRERANLILRLWKAGLMNYSAKTIRLALITTGDLDR